MHTVIKKENGEIWIVKQVAKCQLPLEEGDISLQVESLPDRDFRDCWKVENNLVKVDLPKARIKRLQQLREERDQRLLELDAEQARLISVYGDLQHEEIQAIFAEKQALRDMSVKAEADLAAKLSSNTIKVYSLEDAIA